MSKISIIIPVYNTGEYLPKCIYSIIQQTYKDLEIIIIDDGSKKGTAEICDSLAKEDNRIIVYHKKNEGVSIARNFGIGKASGEYIGFVDSDDWIDFDMYENLIKKIKKFNVDMVMCDATTIFNDNSSEQDTFNTLSESKLITKEEINSQMLFEIAGSAWRCLYRRANLINYKIKFPSGLKFSEDRIFNLNAIGNSKRIYYLKKSLYNRYVRKGSAVNSYYPEMKNILERIDNESINVINRYWGDSYISSYWQSARGLYYACITNTFNYKSKKSLKEKYNEIKNITEYQPLIETILSHKNSDIRAQLIINKRILILCLLSFCINLRNKIRR